MGTCGTLFEGTLLRDFDQRLRMFHALTARPKLLDEFPVHEDTELLVARSEYHDQPSAAIL